MKTKISLIVIISVIVTAQSANAQLFLRGDINNDGLITLADASAFNGICPGFCQNCDLAADVNDDGSVTIADLTYLMAFLADTSSTKALPQPYPFCGLDPTDPQPGENCCELGDGDSDDDGIADAVDNCPFAANPSQTDSDSDGFGEACDCDDSDADAYPQATETCDGVDNDCDGVVDNAVFPQCTAYFADNDGDGWGSQTGYLGCFCDAPAGSVSNAQDCDDNTPNAEPCCCDLSGDADNDGTNSIGDVTYLISYIFFGALPPACCAEGDADQNGSITIADVTFLLAHIFMGGPQPLCGSALTCSPK